MKLTDNEKQEILKLIESSYHFAGAGKPIAQEEKDAKVLIGKADEEN